MNAKYGIGIGTLGLLVGVAIGASSATLKRQPLPNPDLPQTAEVRSRDGMVVVRLVQADNGVQVVASDRNCGRTVDFCPQGNILYLRITDNNNPPAWVWAVRNQVGTGNFDKVFSDSLAAALPVNPARVSRDVLNNVAAELKRRREKK